MPLRLGKSPVHNTKPSGFEKELVLRRRPSIFKQSIYQHAVYYVKEMERSEVALVLKAQMLV